MKFDGIDAFYARCVANGAAILKPLTPAAWGTKDFYVEDTDGYIVCFGGRAAAGWLGRFQRTSCHLLPSRSARGTSQRTARPLGASMSLSTAGFELIDSVVPPAFIERLLARFALVPGRSGRRDALDHPAVQGLINSHLLQTLPAGFFPVSATLFWKHPERNWRVTWHQDTSVPAQDPALKTHFKNGIPHIQPGAKVLSELVAARVHFDPSGPDTGGLSVVPASHLLGIISEVQIAAVVKAHGVVTPDCGPGSVFLMKPLLLHSSAPSHEPTHRRVLHVVFAAPSLREFPWAATRGGG